MNNRPKHLQYRRNIYKKNRTKAIAVIIAVALVVVFILFLIIGNALHKKTSGDEPSDDNPTETETDGKVNPLPSAAAVGAYALPLLEDGSSFSSRLSAIPEGAEAVCINLNTTDGTLCYRSELSSEFSFLKYASDASSLSGSISSINDRELYASALLHVPSFALEDDLAREIYLAGWCAVAVEAIRAGADDCLIKTTSAGSEEVDKLCALADLIHGIEKDAVIGIVIPEDVLSASNSEVLISKLSGSFNYLALNATGAKEDEDVGVYIETRVAQMQMQLIYYKMRVLLPTAEDEATMQSYIDSVKKYNAPSWQFMP